MVRFTIGRRDRDAQPGPAFVDAGHVAAGAPWGVEPDVREVRNFQWTPGRKDGQTQRDVLSGGLLSVAGFIIAASAFGAGYVAYNSQRLFADAHLQGSDHMERARIIAALPDAGWGAMALVALVAALRGRSSLRARTGVIIFFALSLAAQVMYAPKNAHGGWDLQAVLVAVIAPIALAWMCESFVVEVRRWAASKRDGLDIEESPILTAAVRGLGRAARAATRFPLWLVRAMLAPKETGRGLRDWILDEAPLAPGRTRASMRADDAVARAGTAEQIAEQARQQAAQLVEQAQRTAAEQVAQTRGETEQHVAEIQRQAAAQIEQIRTDMAAQVEDITRRHEQQIAQRSREAEVRIERLQSEASTEIERLTRANTGLADEVDRLREELEMLSGKTTAKARLHALYSRLGRDGDPRYMDRTRIREVAKELGPRAGLQSEGTADAYLREYIAAKGGVNGPVGGRDSAGAGAMIGVNGS
jgi:hypothetical protein